MSRRIILAGGSGFLGQALAKRFLQQNYEVIVLTRSPRARNDAAKEIAWDAKSLGDWTKSVDGAEVVVNLTGKSVDCRYNEANRKAIIASRVDSTRVLGEAISKCKQPPRVWLNSSSATIYKHTFDKPMDETGETGATPEAHDEFSIEVIRKWECALDEAQTPVTRKVALRITMVFGKNGGVFPVLRRLTRFGLGGKMGSGRQFVSWIHVEDFLRAVEWLVAKDDLSGAINFAAPNPLPNSNMMRLMRETGGVPFGLPATEWMLEIGAIFLRTETELILKSRRVVPGKLLASGFQFQFPNLC
ncbi:MAG TPA: TIGR01777 family oxidoreductase, partial [Verrucomicrobiae bacterium]|nr:TIGR01777 family oxidoreductase [Verrucomicrobiae bacterium]